MKKLNKWIAGLLCMMLVITMIAGLGVTEVKAEGAVESYNLWVGETEVTSANSSGSGWSYDDETTTLTLNGFQYCGNGHTGSDDCYVGGIYYSSYERPENKKTLTIKLEGNNRIECTNGYGMYIYGNLVIDGSGSLDVEGTKGVNLTGSMGINVEFHMTMNGGTVNATAKTTLETKGVSAFTGLEVNGGNLTAVAENASYSNSYGIDCNYGLIINGGVVKATAGSCGDGKESYGINTPATIKIADNVDVEAHGFTAAMSKSPEGYTGTIGKDYPGGTGTPTSYKLRVGGVEVTSANTSGIGWSYDNQTRTLTLDGFIYEGNGVGIQSEYGDLTINIKGNNKIKNTSKSNWWDLAINIMNGKLTIEGDGTLEATGGTGSTSCGISSGSKLTINSGTVIATAQSAENAMAIYTYGIVMNGGKLIAQSSDATNGSSYGIGSRGDIIINGGTVTATAGTASQESYGLEISSVSGVEGKILLSSNAIVDASGVTAASNKKPEGYIDEIGTTFKHYAPTITDGANSSYVQGSQNTVYFHSSNTFTSFKKVLVDNKEISADCYTATEGSIVITFKPEYLNTLAVGTHSISIVSEEGTAITNFTVQAVPTTPTPSEPSTTQGESTTTSTPASTSTASTQGSQQVIPTIIEGAGSSYTQGSGNTIYFRSSDAFANFQKVMVDNAEISADCYTATEGSIIITLKPEYLSTLAAGSHSISIVSANGVATANFEVQTADTTAVSPKTGDNGQAALWIALLILSCGALTAVGIRKKVR